MNITVISESDRRLIQSTVDAVRRAARLRPQPIDDSVDVDPAGASLYLVFTPPGGVPAFTGTFVATAYDVYKNIEGTLFQAGFQRSAYNLGGALTGNVPALIKKDPYGAWYVEGSAGSELVPDTCVVGKDCGGNDLPFRIPAAWIDRECCADEAFYYCLEAPAGTATASTGVPCDACGGVTPLAFCITIAGLTSNPSHSCSPTLMNRRHTFNQDDPCHWATGFTVSCSDVTRLIALSFYYGPMIGGVTGWHMVFSFTGGPGIAISYSAGVADWDCRTPLTLYRDGGSTDAGNLYDNWPATLTVGPC